MSPLTSDLPFGAPPPFGWDVFQERDHVRVAPSGELDIATVGELEQTLRALVASPGCALLVLDLRNLSFMDSTGLRLLLERDAASRENSHRFALIAGPPEVQRLFSLTDTLGRFEFLDPPPGGR